MPGFFALPAPDAELALAVRLLDGDSNLDLRILDRLVGEPQRYTALKPALNGRNDTVLNRALARLRASGLIVQRLDLQNRQKMYGLTTLGKLVLYRVQQMGPHHESISAYERGNTAPAA